MVFSSALGLIIFDIFISISEDDITDILFLAIMLLLIFSFISIILSSGSQLFYLVSNTSSDDMSLRLVIFDLVNNSLCVLRVFVCLVRFVFYDIQVETVDLLWHYGNSVNFDNI